MLERLLLALSRDRDEVAGAGQDGRRPLDPEEELQRLRATFPSCWACVDGSLAVDFGCGEGRQAVALALLGAREVIGLDINEEYLAEGRALASEMGVDDRVSFRTNMPESMVGQADLVFSQNAMEHFSEPLTVLEQMHGLVREGGLVAITFAPPWFHPYGAHLHYMTPLPWVHLLFPERTVMKVRERFRADGAKRYEEVEGGLNRMTLRRFERLLERTRFTVEELRYRAVKGVPVVTRVPFVREFATNQVDCLLRRPAGPSAQGSA